MAEDVYLDTSFLLKAYVPESSSDGVLAFLSDRSKALIITSLTDVEMASSLFRKLPKFDAQRLLTAYRNNRLQGVFQQVPLPESAYQLAGVLSEQYAETLKLRSLDLLHLATVLTHRVGTLATFDVKLAQAAEASGVAVFGARP